MNDTGRVKRIRVGDDVQTYCGRCKAERAHLIAAMKSDTVPAQVICRTCHNRHNFRAGADAAPARTRTAARAGARAPVPMRGPNDPPPRPYSTKESYAVGSFIEHPQYGTGRVEGSRDNKIDVRFGGVMRTLIHAG